LGSFSEQKRALGREPERGDLKREQHQNAMADGRSRVPRRVGVAVGGWCRHPLPALAQLPVLRSTPDHGTAGHGHDGPAGHYDDNGTADHDHHHDGTADHHHDGTTDHHHDPAATAANHPTTDHSATHDLATHDPTTHDSATHDPTTHRSANDHPADADDPDDR
jgi:hypothetical protein